MSSDTVTDTRPQEAAAPAPSFAPWILGVDICLDPKGLPVGTEPVDDSDLHEHRRELWWECGPRRGQPSLAPAELAIELQPRFLGEASGNRCRSFALEGQRPDGEVVRLPFDRESLEWVAARATRRLREEGRIAKGELTYYHVTATRRDEAPAPAPTALGMRVVERPQPLHFETLLLAPFLEAAGVDLAESSNGGVRPPRDPSVTAAPRLAAAFPVFYTAPALERAERIARSGANRTPPVETGALLVGPLCSCPETGEAFAIVLDVLEAVAAEEATYSLAFTGDTWNRVQAVMRAKAAHPATRAHRLLGQTHGHNFSPLDSDEPCADCADRPVCTTHTAHLSSQDLAWCRATFRGEPWQLAHIFGLNARDEPVDTFYGVAGGALRARGFHVLPAAAAERLLTDPAPPQPDLHP